MTGVFRLSRAEARRHVLRDDANRRGNMPIFRDQPPLSDRAIEEALPLASARHAFWATPTTRRPTEETLAGATPGQIATYCVAVVHADICNGGFHQCFFNFGDLAVVTAEAFSWIGAAEHARLLQQAMERFPDGVAPASLDACRQVLADVGEGWRPWLASLEKAYFALDHAVLDAGLGRVVAERPGDFFVDR